jgi:Gpi18-like mannosyltransferase
MKSKIAKLEKKLQPYEHQLVIIITIIFALIARFRGFHFMSYDMGFVLTGWYNYIIEHGGFPAFKNWFYNYNPPYLYLLLLATYIFKPFSPVVAIKLVSIIFDFLAAFFAYKLVDLQYPKSRKSLFAFIFILYAPTVVSNSAYWGQCDMIYTSLILGCLYYLLKRKNTLACFYFGLALSLKLQAMFFAPVVFILLLKRYIKWYLALIIPLVNYLLLLPVYFAGRPMIELLTIYIGQTQTDEYLTIFAPTFYQWISNEYFYIWSNLGLVLAGLITLVFSIIVARIKFKITPNIMIQISLISVIIVPFFLPKMHERYFFLADVISIIFAVYNPKYWFIPILIILSSLLCYYPALTGIVLFPISYLSGVMLLIIIILLLHLFQNLNYSIRQDSEVNS